MEKRLLHHDSFTGLSQYHSYNPLTNETTIETVGDCEPFLEQNKVRQNDPEFSRKGMKGDMWLFASIPPAIQTKWLIEDGLDVFNPEHSDRLFKKLADPEYRFLKCTTGKHL